MPITNWVSPRYSTTTTPTYLWTQWAADRIQLWWMSTPPHQWPMKPSTGCNNCSEACHGNSPSSDSLPIIIRPFRRRPRPRPPRWLLSTVALRPRMASIFAVLLVLLLVPPNKLFIRSLSLGLDSSSWTCGLPERRDDADDDDVNAWLRPLRRLLFSSEDGEGAASPQSAKSEWGRLIKTIIGGFPCILSMSDWERRRRASDECFIGI